MEKEYYAHYRPEDQVYQPLTAHLEETADFSSAYCSIDLLKKAAWLTGFYHDIGKGCDEWQEYLKKAIEEENNNRREKMDHSTLGGVAAEKTLKNSLLAEMIEIAIYFHHGLNDAVSIKDGTALVWKRREKYGFGTSARRGSQQVDEKENVCIKVDAAILQLKKYADGINLDEYWKSARADLDQLGKQIFALEKRGEKAGQYGNKQFFLGMCERMLFSSLMDGDVRNTVDFANKKETVLTSEQAMQQVWEQGIQNLEEKLKGFRTENRIDQCRAMISAQCKDAAVRDEKLYRLSVPTGAGKTLSGLRFALHCAKQKKKRHIFYIAPFRSILEQNADEIRSVFGEDHMVLEHHSDIICKDEDQMERYERLIENWDEVPVIVTTAVQFFDTLFKEKKSNLRRFHSLSNSVIILDEVQAFPIKLIQLFNMASNFLTELCNTTIVLCTATQPLLDRVRENRLLPPTDIVKNLNEYEEAFRRVEFSDDTAQFPNGASAEQIAEYILEKEKIHKQVLVIVNTKACAETLYQMLKDRTEGKLTHLSTKMCAEHRSSVLRDIRKDLEDGEGMVCISTQLVEAGVDFSFQCVIRSLAGLDNLIQAAGRCNRNGKADKGYVYLVALASELENVSRIPDIKKAQEAMQQLLIKYHQNPDAFENRLDSGKAIDCYYQFYFYNRQNEMNYAAKISGVPTNLVDLFSANHTFAKNVKNVYFKQAFYSAGQAFQVIEEKDGADVVVPFGQAEELLKEFQESDDGQKRKMILRKLQRYTVHLSNGWIQKLKNAVYGIEENRILVLADGYYSRDTGVVEYPVEMPFLDV
ncbi:MAG: CRISPR-associated helicase Cas3' [Eubacteriales bacterium]|nr:CRISPR-associated helicase Cas3' [Eubacteriales bacterium]